MHARDTRIFSRSMELTDLVVATLDRLPPRLGFIADQLRRASASVPLNFLEGCGRTSAVERRRFFIIAAGSANECGAAFEVIVRHRGMDPGKAADGKTICDHLVGMLHKYR